MLKNNTSPKKKLIQLDLALFLPTSVQIPENHHNSTQNVLQLGNTLKIKTLETRNELDEEFNLKNWVEENQDNYIDYQSLPTIQIQEFARSRKIPNRSKMPRGELADFLALFDKINPSFEEMQRILGKSWFPLPDNLGFIYKEKSIICSTSSNFKAIVDSKKLEIPFNPLNSNIPREEIEQLIEIKNTFNVIRFQEYFYEIGLIDEVYRILGPFVSFSQNSNGFLLCQNKTKFALIAPIIFD